MVTSLIINNFRSFSHRKIIFEGNTTFITGMNDAGKTSVLEALYVLSRGRSFRTVLLRNAIGSEGRVFTLQCMLSSDNRDKGILFTYEAGKTRTLTDLNGEKKDDSGINAFALFGKNLNLFYYSTDFRRSHFDELLSMTDGDYYDSFRAFNQLMKKKREIIYSSFSEREKEIFIEPLLPEIAVAIVSLVSKRKHSVTGLNDDVLKTLNMNLSFESQFDGLNKEETESQLKKSLRSEIHEHRYIGPHHDKIDLMANGMPVSLFGSHSLMHEGYFMMMLWFLNRSVSSGKEEPMLLCDDFFLGIDRVKRDRLIGFIPNSLQLIVAQHDVFDIPGRNTQIVTIDRESTKL